MAKLVESYDARFVEVKLKNGDITYVTPCVSCGKEPTVKTWKNFIKEVFYEDDDSPGSKMEQGYFCSRKCCKDVFHTQDHYESAKLFGQDVRQYIKDMKKGKSLQVK